MLQRPPQHQNCKWKDDDVVRIVAFGKFGHGIDGQTDRSGNGQTDRRTDAALLREANERGILDILESLATREFERERERERENFERRRRMQCDYFSSEALRLLVV